jgi:Na+/H+ antiporter NhaD/arsenite permease-like protein
VIIMERLTALCQKEGFTLILIFGVVTALLSKLFATDTSALGVAGCTIAGLALFYYREQRVGRRAEQTE